MSEKYKFYDSRQPHFISFATIQWIDIFIRRIYSEIIVDSLDYCINNKGLILNAWCIMTNHIHLIARSENQEIGDIMRDMKKFTSKEIVNTIKGNSAESRKRCYLARVTNSCQHYTQDTSSFIRRSASDKIIMDQVISIVYCIFGIHALMQNANNFNGII